MFMICLKIQVKKLTIRLGMAMCAMIETYDYPVTFFSVIFFSIQLSIMQTLIFYLNFIF